MIFYFIAEENFRLKMGCNSQWYYIITECPGKRYKVNTMKCKIQNYKFESLPCHGNDRDRHENGNKKTKEMVIELKCLIFQILNKFFDFLCNCTKVVTFI